MSANFAFEVFHCAGAARLGRLTTAHGAIDTPAFMPVGTAGTVKAMLPESVASTGAQIILGNTYHLMLRPGAERVAELGGLHRFMNWQAPILTDSGGYQVMSLAALREIDETGVAFRSHLDGSRHKLTPERSIEIQDLLDADVTMAFDECTPFPATVEQASQSMTLSMRWASRSRQAFRARPGYGIFGIVQGGVFAGLRQDSARALRDIGFDGYAVGGLARPHCPGLHAERHAQSAQRAPRRRHVAARCRMRLPGLQRLQPRLSPPSLPLRRDPGEHAVDVAQPALLWRPHEGSARGDFVGHARRFRRRLSRRPGARRPARRLTMSGAA